MLPNRLYAQEDVKQLVSVVCIHKESCSVIHVRQLLQATLVATTMNAFSLSRAYTTLAPEFEC